MSLNHTYINVIVGIPQNVNFSVAKDTFLRVPGIVTVHNLRIWGLTTDKTALSAHLVIGKLTLFTTTFCQSINPIESPFSLLELNWKSLNGFSDPSRNAQDILKEASTKIREKYNIYEMTLQVEEFHEDMDECTQCQDSPER